MIEILLSFFSDIVIAAFLTLSPSRIVRKILYKTPLQENPEHFAHGIAFFVIDCMVWGAIAFVAIRITGA